MSTSTATEEIEVFKTLVAQYVQTNESIIAAYGRFKAASTMTEKTAILDELGALFNTSQVLSEQINDSLTKIFSLNPNPQEITTLKEQMAILKASRDRVKAVLKR